MRWLLSTLVWLASAVLMSAQGNGLNLPTTTLAYEDIDPAATAEWLGGVVKPLSGTDIPRAVLWTRTTTSAYGGRKFGESSALGPRHFRVGFKRAVPIGSILFRGVGRISVLRDSATYPGDLADEFAWLPARRFRSGVESTDESSPEDYGLWVLPPGTSTRAIRFSHVPLPADASYNGWVGGALLLSERLVNLAAVADVKASVREEAVNLINNENNDKTFTLWDNGKTGQTDLVSKSPPWVMLSWSSEVSLRGLISLWSGFGSAEVDAYSGPASTPPADAPESDWKMIGRYGPFESWYPLGLGPNFMDFGSNVVTRGVRLRMTSTSRESHPHLKGVTAAGKRIWICELMAVQSLGLAVGPKLPQPTGDSGVPPLRIPFTLKEAGYVTLVVEDAQGHRVKNLLSETPFRAGENVAFWDGTDDVLRDPESAGRGISHIPSRFVAPAEYRVRGLVRPQIDAKYLFSAYNSGTPPWPTEDHTGGWLANHSPPCAALYLPGSMAPGGKPLVYLGSYVTEGGDGLAWVDLDGHKRGGKGWIGGTWTGAPFLARDDGPDRIPGIPLYVGAAWDADLRLNAFTGSGESLVVPYKFAGGKGVAMVSGIAARNGVLVASLPRIAKLLLVDARAKKIIAEVPVANPRGLAFAPNGSLFVLTTNSLLRYDVADWRNPQPWPAPIVIVRDGLEDPQQLTLDAKGRFFISVRGNSHQVKVFSPEGKLERAIGKAGIPKAGAYDPLRMNNPDGLAIDERGHLWVTENDFQPKRVSLWSTDGAFIRAFYGPPSYGGGGQLDPSDRTLFYYYGMELRLNWETGESTPSRILYRPAPGEMAVPDGPHAGGFPETMIPLGGHRYFVNCFNSSPTQGTAIGMIWLDNGEKLVPVAAAGAANAWSLLKADNMRNRWPSGVDLRGDYWRNITRFGWSDADGDAKMDPAEVQMVSETVGSVTVMPDLSFVFSRAGEKAVRFAPTRFSASGVPSYDFKKPQALYASVQAPPSTGGDQVLVSTDGWSVLTTAPKPFSPFGFAGVHNGEVMWSYPSLWPGLHASHSAPPPSRPGEVIGSTRLMGGLFTPTKGEAGPMWAINANMGSTYLFTVDGLMVGTLFKDFRQAPSWSMPSDPRGMLLNEISLGGEHFFPSITQTSDGDVYMVAGNSSSIVQVEGLDQIRRIAPITLHVSAEQLDLARQWKLKSETKRQARTGGGTLKIRMASKPPALDGSLVDWPKTGWVDIDKAGVAAWFNSNSKPRDVTSAIVVADGKLFVAFKTDEKELLQNSGETPTALFKSGGALDLMLGTDAKADPKRTAAVAGDLRLLVTTVKGKVRANLYRAVQPGSREKIPFSSPLRTITFDEVKDVSREVTMVSSNGVYELSIPLKTLGFQPEAGQVYRGDIGVLRGNGFQTLQRAYWFNKATGLVSDVPSEAELTPQLWGRFEVEAAEAKQ